MDVRAALGCAYLPRAKRAFPWRHQGDEGPPFTVCAGYTTKLPEVVEAAGAFQHWEKGTIEHRFRGYEITETLMDALEILGAGVAAVQAWTLKRQSEK